MSSKINIKNRKASFEYQFIATFVAGIMLVGTEIKSIRNNQANISDAHCIFIDNELFVKNLHIAEYSNGGKNNHESKRQRKLFHKVMCILPMVLLNRCRCPQFQVKKY